MKKKNNPPNKMADKRVIIWAIVVVILLSAGFNFYLGIQKERRKQVYEEVVQWAELAPLPSSASLASATKESVGPSLFNFRVVFTAPKSDIDKWFEASRRVNRSVTDAIPNTGKRYSIDPKDDNPLEGWVTLKGDTVTIYLHIQTGTTNRH